MAGPKQLALAAIFVCFMTAPGATDPFLGERVDEPSFKSATFDDYAKPYFPKADLAKIDPYWHPYIGKLFEAGLSAEDLALSRERQKAGECETVLTFEMKGFFALHPATQSDFARPKLRKTFETEIVPGFSPGYRRCLAYSRLNLIIEQTKLLRSSGSHFILFLPSIFPVGKPDGKRPADVLNLERAALTLLSLAVCYRYQPAFTDVRYLMNELDLMLLAGDSLLNFHEMAVKADASYPKLDILAQEAFRKLHRAGIHVIEDGKIYKVMGPGGFMTPQRFTDLCEVY